MNRAITCLRDTAEEKTPYARRLHAQDPAEINLGTLGNYGGPTQTIPLLPGSAAIDAGEYYRLPAAARQQRPAASPARSGPMRRWRVRSREPRAASISSSPSKRTTLEHPPPSSPSPPTAARTYNYNVDCNNDGVNEASAQTGNYTCNYAAAGTYTVRIKDNTGLGKASRASTSTAVGIGENCSPSNSGARANGLRWTAPSKAANMTMTASDSPDLSGVTDLSFMFSNASAFNQNIGSWNTANVTDMSHMFLQS